MIRTIKRADHYGDSLLNRMRFLLESAAGVPTVWSEDKATCYI